MSEKGRRDIVLFLGAGFSKEAELPTMADFGRDSDKEGESIRKHEAEDPRNGYEMFSDAYREFKEFQAFCERAHKFVNIDVNNLESMFCMAEAMVESNIKEMHMESYNRIKRWLWKIYHQCPPAQSDKKTLVDPYFGFIDTLKEHELMSRINVITTNYDLLFEYISWRKDIKCAYPFEKEHPKELRVLEDKTPYVFLNREENFPIVCKLHGSINFFEKDGEFFISDNVVPKLPCKDIWIGKSCIPDLPEILAFDALHELEKRGKPSIPAIIPPTYAKLEGRSWLRAIWNAALKSIQDAKYIIFIGYSMPQTDVFMHAMIQSAMAMRKHSEAPKVFVVNPSPSEGYIKLFNKVIIEIHPFGFGETHEKRIFNDIFKECKKD